MSDLKFDKKDLGMVLECLDDLKYASCKEAVADHYFNSITVLVEEKPTSDVTMTWWLRT